MRQSVPRTSGSAARRRRRLRAPPPRTRRPPRRWRGEATLRPTAATRAVAEAAPARHHAPALRAGIAALGAQVAAGGRPLVLDLGPSLGSNIHFLAARGFRVRIVDLYSSLGAMKWRGDGERFGADVAAGLERPPAEERDRASLVLYWDLLNYLTLPNVRLLAAAVHAWCHPDARAAAMIATLKDQPATPLSFRIEDQESVAYDLAGAPPAPSPRHKPADLERALQPFAVEGSWILRNGFREYLFGLRA